MTREECKLDLGRDAPSRSVWVTLSTTGETLNLWDAVSTQITSYRNGQVSVSHVKSGASILPLRCLGVREDNIKATQALDALETLVGVCQWQPTNSRLVNWLSDLKKESGGGSVRKI